MLCTLMADSCSFQIKGGSNHNQHLAAGLTGVGICGTHHNHRGANASGLPQAQAVVLLLSKDRKLVIRVIHINDDLQETRKKVLK